MAGSASWLLSPDACSSLLFHCSISGIITRGLYSLTLSGIIATLIGARPALRSDRAPALSLALGLLCSTATGLMTDGAFKNPKKCGARGDNGAQSRGAGHKIADFRLDLMDLLSSFI